MAKLIIGLAGKIGVGKETVGDMIAENDVKVRFRFSDTLYETLDRFDLEKTRENVQKLSTLMREHFDEDVLARAMVKRVRNETAELVIVDGVRRAVDVQHLRDVENFRFVYIHVDPKVRYERYVSRNKDVGDDKITYEEFLAKDDHESEKQIEALKEKADFIVENNGTYDDLAKNVADVRAKIEASL
jgi:dephospho-CoA kinase